MQQLSLFWQEEELLAPCVNGYEALDTNFENIKQGISFAMLGHACEKAMQFSVYETWYDEDLSLDSTKSFMEEELTELSEYYAPLVLASLKEVGFSIDTDASWTYSWTSSRNGALTFSLKQGLFEDTAHGIILACENANLHRKLDIFIPAIWKFACIESKDFNLLTKISLAKSLKSTYAQLQGLMAAAKISHALLSLMDCNTLEVKHIWVEFDKIYFSKIMQRLQKVLDSTEKGLWLKPLAKDVMHSCSACNYNSVCFKNKQSTQYGK